MANKTYLTPEEIRKMIDWPDNLRDKLIISFYSDTGCRASEMLRVKKEDVDLESRTVLIPHLKRGTKKKCPGCGTMAGRTTTFCSKCGTDLSEVTPEGIEERNRLITVGDETARLLEEWMEPLKEEDTLIQISRQQVYNIIRNAAEGIGIKGKAMLNPETGKKHYVHPHNLRDSLAVRWLGVSGSDANAQKALQEHLGHQNFETTMRYNKLAPSQIKEIGDRVRQMTMLPLSSGDESNSPEDESITPEKPENEINKE